MLNDVYLYPVPAGVANDVWLRDPSKPASPASSARDDKPPGRGRHLYRVFPPVPIHARSLFHSLLRRYGPVNGQRIYQRMELERKGPFAAGAKYDPEERDG